jgi:hypothetical protein
MWADGTDFEAKAGAKITEKRERCERLGHPVRHD